jgi:dTMP kinase
MKRGMFIAFEGPDGSGKTTQLSLLTQYIKSRDKYNEVCELREPTREATDILTRLRADEDAFSNGDGMARGYVLDRKKHYDKIEKVRSWGWYVICDRFKMSTCTYQAVQGVPLQKILDMYHERNIGNPDVNIFVDIDPTVAANRRESRGQTQDKFEQADFQRVLSERYRDLARLAQKNESVLGPLIWIDGNNSVGEVAREIREKFEPFYERWASEQN